MVATAIESACIPFPSEVIMPSAGWLLAAKHGLGWSVVIVGFWGAVGNVIGFANAYGVGVWGGGPLRERYRRWILIRRKDLHRADQGYARWAKPRSPWRNSRRWSARVYIDSRRHRQVVTLALCRVHDRWIISVQGDADGRGSQVGTNY